MPRPRKCRRVCRLPENEGFQPLSSGGAAAPVILNVDEYEAIRLIDLEGLSQEECGEYMGIARTTVQQIYGSARRKLARALVEGLPLRIAGGDFSLCDGTEQRCCRRNCHRRQAGNLKNVEDFQQGGNENENSSAP